MTASVTGPGVHIADLSAIGTRVRVATTDPFAVEPARRVVADVLRALDEATSRFRPTSEVGMLNAVAADSAIRWPVESDILWDCLLAAEETEQLTGGLVTPAIGAAVIAWGYDGDLEEVFARDPATLPSGAPLVLPGRWHLDRDTRTVDLSPGTALDLGASAKARTADLLADVLVDRFGGGFLVDLGGDICCRGAAPVDGWRIGVTDWSQSMRQTLCVHGDLAVCTSSVLRRRWGRGDGIAHHIIDPRTGAPAAEIWAQVSCAAPSALQANAASTAAIILGDDAIHWLERQQIAALLVTAPDLLDDATVTGRSANEIRVGGWPRQASEHDV